MKSPRIKRIKVNCKQKECPFWSNCAEIPTEIVSYSEKAPLRLLFVGQGGGAEEEEHKRPFIGPAGKTLRSAVESVFKYQGKLFNYALSNTIRCRPPNNRIPTAKELKYCLNYLKRDIEFLKPQKIVALGANVANTIGNVHMSMTMRDQHGCEIGSIFPSVKDVMVTYHPSPRNKSRIDLDHILANDINIAYERIKGIWEGYMTQQYIQN